MKKFIILILLYSFLLPDKINAQFVYPHELCSGAMPLAVSLTTGLNNPNYISDDYADAAFSPIPHCTGISVRRDFWYKFTASDTAVSIVAQVIPVINTAITCQLFTGTCEGLTSIACYSGALSYRLSGLSIGQEYYIRTIGALSLAPSDQVIKNINLLAKPVNDDCPDAVELPVWNANTEGTRAMNCSNAMATLTTGCTASVPSGWTNMEDVWYKFTATAAEHTIKIAAVSGAKGFVYSGQEGSFTSIASFQFISNSEIKSLTGLTPGQTYYIRFASTNPVIFSIGVYTNAPPNDDCFHADTVFMSNSFNCEKNFAVGSRLTATASAGGCSGLNEDVWFIFKATASAVTIRETEGSSARFGLLQGTCGALTCLASNTTGQFTYDGLAVGNYYYLQVGSSSSVRDQSMTVCISAAITNDECSGAISVPVKLYGKLRTTVVYTGNATPSMQHCSSSSSYPDVWYSFIAPDTACLITIDGSGNYQVLNGSCGALTGIYCSGASLPLGSTERTEKVSGLLTGNLYYLRVIDNSSGSQVLSTIDVNRLPSNDECSGAQQLMPQQNISSYDQVDDNGILYATQSLAPCVSTIYTNDIWYRFTATASSAAVISHFGTATIPGNWALGLQVYSGTCGSLNSLTCISQSSSQGSRIPHQVKTITGLTPGDTYYIQQYGNSKSGAVTVLNPPANDAITGAVQLFPSAAGVQQLPSYYNHAATRRFGRMCASSPATMDHDVWFYFVASATSHTVSAGATNSFWDEETTPNVRIETFRGFAGDSLSLLPKLLLCGNNSVALTGLIVGDTIYVRVASPAAGATSIFSMKVSSPASIDDPSGALLLNQKNDYEYAVSTSGTTQSLPSGGCLMADYPDDDVWFKFYATNDAKRIIAGKESNDITLQLFSGSPGNLTPLFCSNNIMVLPASITNGQLYYVRAYSKTNAQAATFHIGLFGEESLDINNFNQPIAALGPNLIMNSRCESDEPYLLPTVTTSNGFPGMKLAEGWWGASYSTPDTWSGDYPSNAALGNLPDNHQVNYGRNKIPRSGKGMFGLLYQNNWNEYITGKLRQPLTVGKVYFVSFYVQFTEASPNVAYNIGAYFSKDSIHSGINTEALAITPHVGVIPGTVINKSNKWYNISGYFTANKDYQYITIGNFGDLAIYAGGTGATYVFMDDVLVAETDQHTLPLQLLEFRGRVNARQQNELYWVTAGETSTRSFEVEWRTDNGTFEKIGSVNAAGNSTANQYYQFLHPSPAGGNNYYRLKMYDLNGQYTYSPVVRIGTEAKQTISAYPNPFSNILNVMVVSEKEEMVLFRIVDIYGRTVASMQRLLHKGSNAFRWNVESIVPGNYLMISTDSRQKTTIKLVKQ